MRWECGPIWLAPTTAECEGLLFCPTSPSEYNPFRGRSRVLSTPLRNGDDLF